MTPEIDGFLLQDDYLFRFRKLCVPRTSLRDYLVCELHAGGFASHFGREKIIEVVESLFYWSSLKKDIAMLIGQCHNCQLAMKTEHWLVHASTYSRLSLAGREYEFCAWTF